MKKLVSFIKKNRTGFKVISMILVLALMVQTVSIAVTAITESGLSIDEMVFNDDSSETIPSIVGEVESSRDRYTKVYELADGSFYEVISNDPIHKNVDGQWEEPISNMDTPESVDEVTSYCSELVESISEEQNNGNLSALSYTVDENEPHILNNVYIIRKTAKAVSDSNELNTSSRLLLKIDDSLLSLSKPNQIIVNETLNIECINPQSTENDEAVLSVQGISQKWFIDESKKLMVYNSNGVIQNVNGGSLKLISGTLDSSAIGNTDFTCEFDITEMCHKWSKDLVENNGLCINLSGRMPKTSIGDCFITRRYIVVDAYDPDFTYHSIDMGYAGQVLVNDLTNTVTILRNEMYYPTGEMPINLYRYFDFSKTYTDSNPAGSGTHWNYECPLTKVNDDEILWEAFDGRTIKFFPVTDENGVITWPDDQGEKYELILGSESNVQEGNYSNIKISSPDGLTYKFGASGKIKTIDDGNNNSINVNYNNETTQEYIISIENNSGYRYKFTYESILRDTEEINSLNKISYQRKISNESEAYETICINDTPIEMSYEYIELPDGNIALSKVTYPYDSETPESDRLAVEYLYDNGRLVGIVDIDKRKLEIAYTYLLDDTDPTTVVDNYPSASCFKELVLNKSNAEGVSTDEQYLETPKSSLRIDRRNTYHRAFENELREKENLHYTKEFDLLYYTNNDGKDFYADYSWDNGERYISQIVSPEYETSNCLMLADFEPNEFDEGIDVYWSCFGLDQSTNAGMGSLSGKGERYATLNGSINDVRYLGQEVYPEDFDINANAGDVFVIGGYANAVSSAPNDTQFFGIEVYDVSTEDTLNEDNLLYRLDFDPTMDDQVQFRLGAFKLNESVEKFYYQLVYSYQTGYASFDDVLFYKSSGSVDFFAAPVTENINDDADSAIIPSEPSDTTDEESNNDSNEIYNSVEYTDNNNITTIFDYNKDTGFLEQKRMKTSDTPSYRGEHDLSYVVDKYSYDAMGALREVKRVVDVVEVATPGDATLEDSAPEDSTPEDSTPEDSTPEDSTPEDSTLETATPGDATQEGSEKKYETKENTTQYEYEYGKISSVSHNNATYNFNYDSYGNLKDIVAELYAVNKEGEVIETLDVTVASYDYTSDTYRNINKITYSNGYVLEYTVDENGKITSISERSNPTSESVPLYDYVYSDENGDLYKINDYVSYRVMEYSDNLFTVKTLADNSEGELLYSKRIENDEEEYNVFSIEYTKTSYEPTYNDDSKTTTYSSTTTTDMGYSVEIDSYAACDYFGRLKNSSVIVSEQDVQNNGNYITSHSVENEITYFNNTDGDLTTNLLETYSSTIRGGDTESDDIINEFTTEYSYDKAGRITHIYYKQNDNSRDLKYYYEYDIAGQLVKEADFSKMTYTEYVYDYFGNVAEKKIYSGANCFEYENGSIIVASDKTPTTINFEYAAIYKDVLANYKVNGVPNQINHDLYGNPYKYHRIDGDEVQTYYLEWEGNQLHTVNPAGSDSLYEYKYDDNGRRTQKIMYKNYDSNNPEAKEEEMIMDYVWDDNRIMGYRVKYLYDTISITIDTAIIYDELDYPIGLKYCTSGLTDGEDNPNLSNEDIFWFVKDGQGKVVAIFSEKSGYTIGCSYTTNGELEVNNSGDFESELNQRIEDADDFETGLLIALSAVLAIQFSTTISTDANHATHSNSIMDIETGLYYCQNKYYSPEYGRYINLGNIEEIVYDLENPFNSNPFVFNNNDPINLRETLMKSKSSSTAVGIQAELSKSIFSFSDSVGIEFVYDPVKDELYAYYYSDAKTNIDYTSKAIEHIKNVLESIPFSDATSLNGLAANFKINNSLSLSYFSVKYDKSFAWPYSYLNQARVKSNKTNGYRGYTAYGSGYQTKGVCFYPTTNIGFVFNDLTVEYTKLEVDFPELKNYLAANRNNIIATTK